MSMTTFYSAATSAAELAEALLLTSATSSGSSSVVDEDMIDFDEDSVFSFDNKRSPSIDLITGDTQAVTSAVFCFVKNFVCASGSSTVAIDNKIEQAMDLVKSHLMFAVREEVEVLKERIDVLMERIAYLEAENQILRAAANQDTLAQIAQLEATSPGSGIDNNNSSSSSGTAPNQNTSSSNGPAPAAGNQPERSTTSQLPNGTSPAP